MPSDPKEKFTPFVSPQESPAEFTWFPIIAGSLLGIVFGASSIYLVLKVGLTVSASIPVSVLGFALFKPISRIFKLKSQTVLQNNILQTAGSAGESIAFGVGLIMPALLILGFDIEVIRVMTVGVFGGLLGVLMMIPLRKAFIVDKHGELKYPEGTACADVLKSGEQGASGAGTLLIGFVIGFIFQFFIQCLKLLKETPSYALSKLGLKSASISADMSAPLLGVGFIIGPRISGVMVAGGVLAYLVILPLITYFGGNLNEPLKPAEHTAVFSEVGPLLGNVAAFTDTGLIRNMDEALLRKKYILFIGAGAVAAGGIISMFKALPAIFGSVAAGFRDLFGTKDKTSTANQLRTERDLPMSVVMFGSIGLIIALMAAPALGLGFNLSGIVGAFLILLFGFLFVTVSSRLTGEIGSSSNPISGMTVCTLLLTCVLLLLLTEYGYLQSGKKAIKLLALTVAGVVCVASSNGGTTSQALKTGYLLGATPKLQTYAILIGSLTSALVVGLVLIMFNAVGSVYTKKDLPDVMFNVSQLETSETIKSGMYASTDKNSYKVLQVGRKEELPAGIVAKGDATTLKEGKYLVNADGSIAYFCDSMIGSISEQDNGTKVQNKFEAPKTQLVALIIDGILQGNLPWDLVIIGVLIAFTIELCGLPSLAFAVGVYLPLSASTPIFAGGVLRWLVDKVRNRPEEGDSSPGVLLSSGYIAGGSIAALLSSAFLLYDPIKEYFDTMTMKILGLKEPESNMHVMAAFMFLVVVLFLIGSFLGRGKKA